MIHLKKIVKQNYELKIKIAWSQTRKNQQLNDWS